MTCCPACGVSPTKVSDSRPIRNTVRRRRACDCGARWTTFEIHSAEYHALKGTKSLLSLRDLLAAYKSIGTLLDAATASVRNKIGAHTDDLP